MIELNSLSFSYKNKKEILKNITYTFNRGSLYILSGRNGSGKTTLGKMMCGLLKPACGSVKINGADIKKQHIGEISHSVGYLFQNPDMQLFASTVTEELLFPYTLTGAMCDEIKKKAEKLITRFGLEDKKDSFPLLMSCGEKQRLALAAIMMRDTVFIIFDEPTSSVDSEGRHMIIDFIRVFVNNGGGALVISHDDALNSVLKPDILLRMDGGNLYEA